MESHKATQTADLSKRSIEEIHHQCREWINEIAFWQEELAFFEKLLEKNALKPLKSDQKSLFERLQNQIIYYKGELVEQYEHDVKEHEKVIANTVKGNKEFGDNQKRHQEIAEQLHQFSSDFKVLKRELFQLIEALN